MPIFGYPYQRGPAKVRNVYAGYSYDFNLPSDDFDVIAYAMYDKYDISPGATTSYIPLTAGTDEWDFLKAIIVGTIPDYGIDQRYRYFNLLDSSGSIISDGNGASVFRIYDYTEDGAPTSFRILYETDDGNEFLGSNIDDAVQIKFLKTQAVMLDAENAPGIHVKWGFLFTGVDSPYDDGFGWEYVLFPSEGPNAFPEYEYWSDSFNEENKFPIYPWDDLPSLLPGNLLTIIKKTVTFNGEDHQMIMKRGHGNDINPTLLHRLKFYVSEDDKTTPGNELKSVAEIPPNPFDE
jgi:hypothetical protein